MLCFKKTYVELIGYCIVENAKAFPADDQPYLNRIYEIPISILETHAIVISDFMVANRMRQKGYGTFLANYILSQAYNDCNISLHAVDDGVWF